MVQNTTALLFELSSAGELQNTQLSSIQVNKESSLGTFDHLLIDRIQLINSKQKGIAGMIGIRAGPPPPTPRVAGDGEDKAQHSDEPPHRCVFVLLDT